MLVFPKNLVSGPVPTGNMFTGSKMAEPRNDRRIFYESF